MYSLHNVVWLTIGSYLMSYLNGIFLYFSFDSGRGGLRYENQFLQISSKLPSRYFYGLGEHEHRQFLHNNFNWKAWPLFTKDEFPTVSSHHYIYDS